MSSMRFLLAMVACTWPLAVPSAHAATEVDLELVLAVDVSYSMDPDELTVQREGYISALTSPEVIGAIRNGIHGRIAVTYVEWAGLETQYVLAGWTLIDSMSSATAFAAQLGEAPVRRAFRTSISTALAFSNGLFDGNGYDGIRRVIDISGDGPNNQGAIVSRVRDEVLAKGTVINGLPLVFKGPSYALMDVEDLAAYYRTCVIGGPGAFVIPVTDRAQFAEAIRTKLVLEISDAGSWLPPRLIPTQDVPESWSCTIGERMWEQRYGR